MNAFEADFTAWAREQARALRKGDLQTLDGSRIAALLEDVAGAEMRTTLSEVEQILQLMLVDDYAPFAADSEPLERLHGLRRRVRQRLDRSPSLWSPLLQQMPALYLAARRAAAADLGVEEEEYPAAIVYDVASILPDEPMGGRQRHWG